MTTTLSRSFRSATRRTPAALHRAAIEALEARALMTAVTFAAPVSYALPAPNDSSGVVAFDYTGDGKPDLAAVNQEADLLSLLANNGDGTFAAPLSVPTGDAPGAIAAADFNGDGKLDLALAISGSLATGSDDEVHVLLNDGAGGFAAPIVMELGDAATLCLATADLNGDGRADVVTGNLFTSADVSVLIGSGDGRFAAPASYATGTSTAGVTLGDINDDGRPDIAAALEGGSAGVLLNNGDGTFGAAAMIDLGKGGNSRPQAVAIGQFVGDASIDLAVTMEDGGGGAILAGDGSGAFALAGGFEAATLDGVLTADFDADGQADLAVTSESSRYVAVHQRGSGGGGFAETFYDFVNAKPDRIASADFNGDGKPDLVATGETTGAGGTGVLDVLLNTTTAIGANNGGGGGGGGGEVPTPPAGAADLVGSLAVLSPASVIGGAKGKATVVVSNAGPAAAAGTVGVSLYASADGALDAGDTLVATTSTAVKLKQGAAKRVKLAFDFPSLPDGGYNLLAKVDAGDAIAESDEANNVALASSGAVTIASPFIDLAGTFAALPSGNLSAGKKGSVAIDVRNGGNLSFKGPVAIKVFASADGVLDASDVELTAVSKSLSLKPGTRKIAKLKFALPSGVTPGQYLLAATIAGGGADADLANNTTFGQSPITFG